MVPRVLEPRLRQAAAQYPIVTVTGPRQSGKTTLCRAIFDDRPYVSLEALDLRSFAAQDPRGFLATYGDGAIFDEVQRVPELLSFLQTEVDLRPTPGRFILTGSANFALLHALTQSLAGRTAVLTLLPFGLEELRQIQGQPLGLFETLWQGGYPAIFDRNLDPADWHAGYTSTYVERDVRSLLKVGNLVAFQTFLQLCAGRTGQLVNLSSLGADAGITHPTARAWISVLEAGYLAWRLPAFHRNLGKRLVKTPKLHFIDTGLVCFLLGIRSPSQLRDHPLRGAIFETWVANEILKARFHRGLPPALSFFRDRRGSEVDVIVEFANHVIAVETKSGATVAEDFFDALRAFSADVGSKGSANSTSISRVLVYGGDRDEARSSETVLSWSHIDRFPWWEKEAPRPRSSKPRASRSRTRYRL